jgi:putative drug exporter of the RND superfamily
MHRRIAGGLTGPVSKWAVVALWLLVAMGSFSFASKLSEVQDNDAASRLPASAESTRALEKLAPFRDPDALPTIVVYEAESGRLTDEQLSAIAAQRAELAALDGVQGEVDGPFSSEDGQATENLVTFDFGPNGWEHMPAAAEQVRQVAALEGVSVHLTGAGGAAADAFEAYAGIDSRLLLATLGVVLLLLLLTYRSPVLWILPIFSVMVALYTAEALIYLLATYAGLPVSGESRGILTVLVIGAGTDYALLLVARYREELRRHEDRHDAMSTALHRAMPALLASAATVALGMLCLSLADLRSTAGLGPVLAIGVAVTLLVMVTLLPALLVVFGRWVFWPKRPTYGSPEPTSSGLWARVGRWIAPRARRVWIGTAAILAVACLGIFQLDAAGLSSDEQYTRTYDSVVGQEVLADHGLTDNSNPITVVSGVGESFEVAAALENVDGVGEPTTPQVRGGVAVVSAPIRTDAASSASFATVREVRDVVHAIPESHADVGGTAAILLDIETASARDNLVIIPLVLIVVMLILIWLLRALVAPLLLVGTVVLSFGAALGISALLFQYVFGFDHADSAFPLFVFVFLVALGIDYNIFLMTRVREETMQLGTRKGSLVALESTGGVITSAGLVLAATFVVLGTMPMVFFVELGTAVALGVMLDTLIVRSVLVTALNVDLGCRIWWPSDLDRRAPSGKPRRARVHA